MFNRIDSKTIGGHLIETLDGVTVGDLEVAFGEPTDTGWSEDEKGYDGLEWHFEGEGGETFRVYCRYGRPRIGGEGFDAAAFKAWLLARVAA